MVPPGSDRIPLVPPYSGFCYASARFRIRGFHALRPAFPGGSPTKPTATSQSYNPEDAVTPRKIRNTVLAADAYIRLNRIDLPVRFDIISVLSSGDVINHIEDAFRSPVWYR